MQEQKNLTIALVLSIIVIGVWQMFFVQPKLEETRRQQAEIAKEQAVVRDIEGQAGAEGVVTPAAIKKELMSRKEAVAMVEHPRLPLENPDLIGSINLKGARFDDLLLKNYRKTLQKNSPNVELLSPVRTEDVYLAEFGWLGPKALDLPGRNTVWQADKDRLEAGEVVTLSWENEQGLSFRQIIELDEHTMFTVRMMVSNSTGDDIQLVPYGMVNRAREDQRSIYISHEGMVGYLNERLQEIDYDELQEEEPFTFKGTKGWLGIGDQYWLAALVPDDSRPFDAEAKHYEKDDLHRYQVSFKHEPVTIPAGQTVEVTQRLFAGPKKVVWLDQYQDNYDIPLFDRAVDYGVLYFLTKPIYLTLVYFFNFLGNFGLAILLLTICIRILLFPLANKSFKSMAQMRLIMPDMMELRERYKDDRVKLNQEMLALYKERKVNPASGCLPILLQLPIFFALYKVLYVTIEMRHAPFYGWIRDLSAPDPTNILNLFGLIEWTPPTWLPAVGALPLLFGVTMFLQQKLNPPPTDPTQKLVMQWLPVILVFLFSGFAAGLVLYWTWNNILAIFQQWVITRKLNKEMHQQVRNMSVVKKED